MLLIREVYIDESVPHAILGQVQFPNIGQLHTLHRSVDYTYWEFTPPYLDDIELSLFWHRQLNRKNVSDIMVESSYPNVVFHLVETRNYPFNVQSVESNRLVGLTQGDPHGVSA
jgi:hypothetical protein